MNFYQFASESPVLTFFLILIIGHTLVGVSEAIFKRKSCSCQHTRKSK